MCVGLGLPRADAARLSVLVAQTAEAEGHGDARARRAGPVVACDDRAELPVQLSGVDMRLGADEGELVAARAEAQDALALVLALAAEVGNAPRRRDDRFISRLKAEAVVALVQALEPDIGQHRVEAAGLAGADALHVFLERAAVRQAGHAVLALHRPPG